VPRVLSGKKEDKLGWRASDTRELIFQDAVVPKENVLGPVNNGFRQFLHTLDGGRIGIAALSLGLAEGALEECLTYTSTRKQFGRPSPASRASTSPSPTWPPRSKPPRSSSITPPGSNSRPSV